MVRAIQCVQHVTWLQFLCPIYPTVRTLPKNIDDALSHFRVP